MLSRESITALLGHGVPYKGTLTPVLILQLSFWFLLLDFPLPVFAEEDRLR